MSSTQPQVCDFGFARGELGDDATMTEYVVTRWYRAPEVMLCSQHYTSAVDIWSTGCCFAELIGVKPLFQGEDYVEQLQLITGVLGAWCGARVMGAHDPLETSRLLVLWLLAMDKHTHE